MYGDPRDLHVLTHSCPTRRSSDLLRGRLRDSDIPRDVGDAGLGEQMTVRFTVQTNGHATDCGIEQSSGNARLDEATCRAIERRYRFRPALDEDEIGRAHV